MRKLLLVITLLLAHGPSVFAQGGHLGTPQEQKACSRDASRLLSKATG
jgi:hypothetical protein